MIGYEGAPRYASAVQAITGDAEIVPPGITLETDRPEYSALKREVLWAIEGGIGALAANFDQFVFSSGPVGRLSVLTDLLVSVDCWLGHVLGGVTGLALQNFAAQRDSRSDKPSTRFFFKQSAATLFSAGLGRLKIPANTWVKVPPYIWTGTTLVIESTVVNVALSINAAGYERVSRPEEIASL